MFRQISDNNEISIFRSFTQVVNSVIVEFILKIYNRNSGVVSHMIGILEHINLFYNFMERSTDMYKVGILTSSDKGAAGQREDKGGPKIQEIIEKFPTHFKVTKYIILPDEKDKLAAAMTEMADSDKIDLIITTGGTGFSKRDVTPEATLSVIERRTPGIPEAMRSISLAITMRAMLSRAEAGIRGNSLIINLPGSPKAIEEVLAPILPSISHGLDILQAKDAECART